jgi:hypothetical protein
MHKSCNGFPKVIGGGGSLAHVCDGRPDGLIGNAAVGRLSGDLARRTRSGSLRAAISTGVLSGRGSAPRHIPRTPLPKLKRTRIQLWNGVSASGRS